MAVGDHNPPHFLGIFNQISEVRDDHIHTVHVVFREGHAAVDDHDLVLVLQCGTVLSDFVQTAQRNDFHVLRLRPGFPVSGLLAAVFRLLRPVLRPGLMLFFYQSQFSSHLLRRGFRHGTGDEISGMMEFSPGVPPLLDLPAPRMSRKRCRRFQIPVISSVWFRLMKGPGACCRQLPLFPFRSRSGVFLSARCSVLSVSVSGLIPSGCAILAAPADIPGDISPGCLLCRAAACVSLSHYTLSYLTTKLTSFPGTAIVFTIFAPSSSS